MITIVKHKGVLVYLITFDPKKGKCEMITRHDRKAQMVLWGQLALSLSRELKDTPAKSGLRMRLSYNDTRHV